MSTNWIPRRPIPFKALAVFNQNGVEARTDDQGKGLVLTDGVNYLHVYAVPEADTVLLERNGKNDPAAILQAVEYAFGITLVSEYDDEYGSLSERTLNE